MNFELPFLGLLIAVVLMVGIAFWIISASSRSDDKRRDDRTAKRMAQQPWDADSSDGRANR